MFTFWKRLRQSFAASLVRNRRAVSARPTLEGLESRTVPAAISWVNKYLDGFDTFFGSSATLARNAAQRAIDDWSNAINRFIPASRGSDYTFRLAIQAVPLPGTTLGMGVIDTIGWLSPRANRPMGGTITLDTDGGGSGWFFDDDAAFTQVIDRFQAQKPGETRQDLYSTVLHEIGHTLGFAFWSAEGPTNLNYRVNSWVYPWTSGTVTMTAPPHATLMTESSGTHVPASSGADLMNPERTQGVRQLISDLDLSILAGAYDYVLGTTRSNFLFRLNAITGQLAVSGTQGNDTITLEPSGSNVRVTVNGFVGLFPLSSVRSIRIDPGTGRDLMTLDAAASELALNTAALGDEDLIHLGPAAISALGAGGRGFEEPRLGTGPAAFVYRPAQTSLQPWTFSGNAGVAGNGSGFTSGNPLAPEGGQVAFLQGTGSASQSVYLPTGSYTLGFKAAQRGNFQSSGQTIRAWVDGNLVATTTPVGTSYADYTTASFSLAAGSHVLRFEGLNPAGGDNTAFIDQVRVIPWAAELGRNKDHVTVATNADGRLQSFVIGTDHALWHRWQLTPNGAWSEWASLGGYVHKVAVGRNQDGRLLVFGVGSNNSLYSKRQVTPGGSWTDWVSDGGSSIRELAVASNADGRLQVFVLQGDGSLWSRAQTAANGSLGAWMGLGGAALREMKVASNADGRLEVFGIGGDTSLWHIWQVAPGGGWSGWESLGGSSLREVAVSRSQDGRLEVFAIGGDTALHTRWQTTPGGSWTTWYGGLGGSSLKDLTVGTSTDGRMEVFAVGGDGALYHQWQISPNGNWSGWNRVGGSSLKKLAVGRRQDGRLQVFVVGSDNALYTQWQVGSFSVWSGWLGLGGTVI